MRRCWAAVLVLLGALGAVCQGQGPATATTRPAGARPAGAAVEALTEAERIVRLRKAVEEGQGQIKEIEQKLSDPASEFRKAEEAFGKLDGERSELTKRKRQLEEGGGEAAALAELDRQIVASTEKWDEARARFALAVEERKALQEKLLATQKKLEQDRKSLEGLLAGGAEKPAAAAVAAGGAGATTNVATVPAAAESRPVVATTAPAVVGESAPQRPKERALVAALQEVEVKKAEVQQASQRVEATEQVRATVAQGLATERRLLEIARKRQQQAQEEQKRLREELSQAAGDAQRSTELWSKLFEARQREWQASADVRQGEERLAELEQQQRDVETQKKREMEEVLAKKREAEQAEAKVQRLKNPFTFYNILQWLLDHGPRLVTICVGMAGLLIVVRGVSKRIAELVAESTCRGSMDDRKNRAQTLVGVFRQTASLVVIGGGAVMLLDEVGVPVVPLLGGAAVVGLAVAFGAQNLIRDYFAGFMVLVEDQYSVGDVVRIGSIAGLVERITLRMTMLRDLEGVAHFIPHGSITTVSNLTHSWSRAVFDVPVAYEQNVDAAISVLQDLANEMSREPAYAEMIVGEPEMLGVDSFAESAVVIKFIMKTRPMKQWTVKREMLRRIKNRFDALGIEIPFPHLTVYHRQGEEAERAEAQAEGAGEGRRRG